MKRRKTTLLLLLVLVTTATIYSCTKSSNNQEDEITNLLMQSVEKNSVEAITISEDLNQFTSLGLSANGLKGLDLTMGTCPAISVNLTQTPYSVSLDWRPGCTGTDNVKRNGMITITLEGAMTTIGGVASMKFFDFVNDGKMVNGIHKVTYAGLNASGWPKYNVLTEAKITYPDKSYITYRSEMVRLQSTGKETATLADDTWRMEGNLSGVTQKGTKWRAVTSKALVKKGECRWVSEGEMLITPEVGATMTVNFGTGSCDNKATMTSEGKSTEITL